MTKPSRAWSKGREASSGEPGAGAERAHLDVARDDERRQRGVGTAGHHRLGAAVAQHREGEPDRVGAGGAGGGRGRRGPAQAERPRRGGAGVVGEGERDRQRADPVGAALEEGPVRLEQGLGAPVDAAERDADALGVEAEVARVLERHRPGDGGQAAAAVHAPRVALAEALAGVLPLQDREGVDRPDALQIHLARPGAAVREGVPEGADSGADGAQHSRSRDHDPSAHVAHLLRARAARSHRRHEWGNVHAHAETRTNRQTQCGAPRGDARHPRARREARGRAPGGRARRVRGHRAARPARAGRAGAGAARARGRPAPAPQPGDFARRAGDLHDREGRDRAGDPRRHRRRRGAPDGRLDDQPRAGPAAARRPGRHGPDQLAAHRRPPWRTTRPSRWW